MSYNSSDDGTEVFGGTVNVRNYIAVGSDDDSLDVDMGAQANFQTGLLLQRSGAGDALMEIDSNGFETETPRTKLQVSNFTMIQPAASTNNDANDQASILLRGNSDTSLYNSIVSSPNNECLRMNASGTTPATLTARSVALNCNAGRFIGSGAYNATQVAGFFGAGANNNRDTLTTSFTNGFVNGANEAAVPATDPTALGTFFTPVAFVGAVRDANDTWYAGWTCNSGVANFGTTNTGACTSLPTN